jgi:pilus assembly protein CpaF
VKEALRMRPTRIIISEVRQAESSTLLIALNPRLPAVNIVGPESACRDVLAPANSAREAITKMWTLPLLAGDDVGNWFVLPTVTHARMGPHESTPVKPIGQVLCGRSARPSGGKKT